MDGKETATEDVSLRFSDSTGYSMFHPSNDDSVTDNSLKNDAMNADNNKASASGKSSSSSSSSDGGFVSGEEEFETASERPGVGDLDEKTFVEGDDADVPFVDSPEVLGEKDVSSVLGEPTVDDDENDVIDEAKMGDLKNSDVVHGDKSLEVDGDEGIVSKGEIGDVSGEVKKVMVEMGAVEDNYSQELLSEKLVVEGTELMKDGGSAEEKKN